MYCSRCGCEGSKCRVALADQRRREVFALLPAKSRMERLLKAVAVGGSNGKRHDIAGNEIVKLISVGLRVGARRVGRGVQRGRVREEELARRIRAKR